MFDRKLGTTIKNNLIESDLWIEKIKKDCYKGDVFLTLRNNQADFYYKGGKLFGYDAKGYSTHIKYASVITTKDGEDEKNYLTEKKLADYLIKSDFKANYYRIKENCSNYSGIEAYGVSYLYHKHSYLTDNKIIVLDVEVALESLTEDEDEYYDRIDILLYDKHNKILHFVEAKHYFNTEIWSKSKPKVLSQIERYESQISNKKRKLEILSGYEKYINIINNIFHINLPKPEDIEPKVTLLIFGFDRDQRNNRLKKMITQNPVYSGIKIYVKGKMTDIETEKLWNGDDWKKIIK